MATCWAPGLGVPLGEGFAASLMVPSACPPPTNARGPRFRKNFGWEADERPDPCSLGLLPSGPDPVGEWLVHCQPPAAYIGPIKVESKAAPPVVPVSAFTGTGFSGAHTPCIIDRLRSMGSGSC